MKIAAVTGTNGKSSTIHYARQLLEHKGKEVWSITNTGILEPRGVEFPMFWCRERGSIKKIIDILSPSKDALLLIEAYSISLLANEWYGTRLDIAAFTSFGRDHLDVHSSMREYFDAKFSLFQNFLKPNGTMIIHERIPNIPRFRYLSKKNENEVIIYNDKISEMSLPAGIISQNYNCAKHISETLADFSFNPSEQITICPLPGRIEKIENSVGMNIFIDYAHNPDGLGFTLSKLKKDCKGKIITVVGCGGNRDSGKRKMMGKVAKQFSDMVIITDDNPRNENASLIRKAIMEGCPKALEIPSRKEAIKAALFTAQKNDTVLVAGMGSDKWATIDFDLIQTDKSVILDIIENLKK
tara:strand:+ start:29 stop:1093 length:1065 start_codon:yes stop_codon:yes gene_type:complete